jgi:hypothetical protein
VSDKPSTGHEVGERRDRLYASACCRGDVGLGYCFGRNRQRKCRDASEYQDKSSTLKIGERQIKNAAPLPESHLINPAMNDVVIENNGGDIRMVGGGSMLNMPVGPTTFSSTTDCTGELR